MASPVDANRAASQVSTAIAQITAGLPAGNVPGDLLILFLRVASTATITTFTGNGNTWTQLLLDSSDATDDNTYVYYTLEAVQAAPTIQFSTTTKAAWCVWRITGAADPATRAPEVSARQVFTTAANAGNPPAISPTGGSKDYLFLACLGLGGATVTGATAPAGYTTGAGFAFAVSTGGSGATNCGICGCSRQATTATEDCGNFTHPAATGGGTAFVIAIHPGGPPPLTVTINDGLALGDGLGRTRAVARTLTDVMTLADLRDRTISALRSLVDPVTLADLISPELVVPSTPHTRSPADTLALADALARATGKSRADALALVDALTRVRTVNRTLADTVTLADARSISEADALTVSDTLLLADLISRARGQARALTDTAVLSDTAARSSGRGRVLADTVALADSTARVVTGASAPWPRQIALAL